ncbi:MAG: helix-turn-helix domain-containing protein [Tetrasphaera sp.]
MGEPWQPATEDIGLVGLLQAFADPIRIAIIATLDEVGTETCSAIGEGLELHKSTLSHHYRVLREAGVTFTEVRGRTRFVRLRRDDLDTRFPGLLERVLTAARID